MTTPTVCCVALVRSDGDVPRARRAAAMFLKQQTLPNRHLVVARGDRPVLDAPHPMVTELDGEVTLARAVETVFGDDRIIAEVAPWPLDVIHHPFRLAQLIASARLLMETCLLPSAELCVRRTSPPVVELFVRESPGGIADLGRYLLTDRNRDHDLPFAEDWSGLWLRRFRDRTDLLDTGTYPLSTLAVRLDAPEPVAGLSRAPTPSEVNYARELLRGLGIELSSAAATDG